MHMRHRYHHQVSHHIHCNDSTFDEDVMNAFPILRFDARQPRHWYHQWQHIYMVWCHELHQLCLLPAGMFGVSFMGCACTSRQAALFRAISLGS